jgi:hypothetical protein
MAHPPFETKMLPVIQPEDRSANMDLDSDFSEGVSQAASGSIQASSVGSASKRSHSAMSWESASILSSQQASGSMFASPDDPEPSNKRLQLTSSSKATGKRPAAPASGVARRPKASPRIVAASAVVGMQGLINRLTDVFERSMMQPEDPIVARRATALQILQENQDGLSVMEKVQVISVFMKNNAAVETYLSLTDSDVRHGWIASLLPSKETHDSSL